MAGRGGQQKKPTPAGSSGADGGLEQDIAESVDALATFEGHVTHLVSLVPFCEPAVVDLIGSDDSSDGAAAAAAAQHAASAPVTPRKRKSLRAVTVVVNAGGRRQQAVPSGSPSPLPEHTALRAQPPIGRLGGQKKRLKRRSTTGGLRLLLPPDSPAAAAGGGGKRRSQSRRSGRATATKSALTVYVAPGGEPKARKFHPARASSRGKRHNAAGGE